MCLLFNAELCIFTPLLRKNSVHIFNGYMLFNLYSIVLIKDDDFQQIKGLLNNTNIDILYHLKFLSFE